MSVKSLIAALPRAALEDIVRSFATLATLAAVLYLYIVGRAVPPELYTILGVFVGYFFSQVKSSAAGQLFTYSKDGQPVSVTASATASTNKAAENQNTPVG